MKRTMKMLLGTFALAISVLAVPAVAAAAPTGSVDSSNRVIFTSGSLTGVFEGNVPHITFYATNELGRTTYQLNFRALIEFNTTTTSSSEGTFESPMMVAKADFDSASWTPTSFYAIKDPSTGSTIGMGFNFTLKSQMQIVEQTPPPQSLKPGDVVLVVKAYNNTRTMTVNGQSVTINTAEIKIDFVLKNWPFASSSDKLALQVNMHSDYNHYELDESTGTATVDATNDEGAGVAEHPYQESSSVEQDVRYASGPVTSSMNVGFFHFVNRATVTSASGTSQSVPVVASYKSEKEDSETFLKLYLVYPYFASGSTLVHDPSFGLQGGLPTLYIIAGGAGVAGLAAVLVIRRRHLQVQKFPKSN
jgi:hypothetical protein